MVRGRHAREKTLKLSGIENSKFLDEWIMEKG
jgi:hypothetical protein